MQRARLRCLAEAAAVFKRPVLAFNDGYSNIYMMSLSQDEFVHFTTPDRAEQIMADGGLSMNPPHQKFGPDAIYGISAVWGKYVPGTQYTHLFRKSKPVDMLKQLVAIVFTTREIPEIGHTEEVLWRKDVIFKDVRVLPAAEGVALLKKAKSPDPDKSGSNWFVLYQGSALAKQYGLV